MRCRGPQKRAGACASCRRPGPWHRQAGSAAPVGWHRSDPRCSATPAHRWRGPLATRAAPLARAAPAADSSLPLRVHISFQISYLNCGPRSQISDHSESSMSVASDPASQSVSALSSSPSPRMAGSCPIEESSPSGGGAPAGRAGTRGEWAGQWPRFERLNGGDAWRWHALQAQKPSPGVPGAYQANPV